MVKSGGVRRAGFRGDIQALRAFAVLAVLLYHLWPTRLTGGFVGVDVFFVISGFLITGALVREAGSTGEIGLARFWARRARRLLPAALTVLLAVTVATLLWVPQNLWQQFFGEVVASTLYVENWLLAANSVDYLAANNIASPVQHFWTLSVEEQFYIAVPLLMIALLAVGRRMRGRRSARRLLLGGLLAITLASFAYSLYLTAVSAPTAYFVTTTRAWEFGAGALLVFLPAARAGIAARAAFFGGSAMLVATVVLLTAAVPFPGAVAAIPVVATVLVLWGGAANGARTRALTDFAPVQFVGGASYSMYLWHWPLIVLLPFVTAEALTTVQKFGIIAATVLLAWLSTRFIENPVRFSTRLLGGGRTSRTVFAWAAAGMAVVVVASGAGLGYAGVQAARAQEAALPVVERYADCLGAMSELNDCTGVVPADVLVPDPAQAAGDDVNSTECWSGLTDSAFNICGFGPEDAPVRIAAIGDSHNNRLLTTYQAIAAETGWRIDVAGHNGCYWTTAVQQKPSNDMVEACENWKVGLTDYLAGHPPYDAIVVTNARNGLPPIVEPGEDVGDATVAGLVAAWAPEIARGTRIIALRDNPTMRSDIVSCVTSYRTEADAHCASPATEALGARDPLMEAAATSGTQVIDLSDLYCPGGICEPVIGNVVVYADEGHLTVTFARTLQSALQSRLQAALTG
ncbi:acyltransferase [Herbiconiux sp. CPCC 205763]|uniref:Acyltransferase n=1 Tax=Herbiconiux aconitum TaxID=2970913 RepID=A0ABT2GMV4_9MICO|nr:acyltransferase family protein [Herbiconiux aconitum]MCS5716610.1 acyltransferase [Herbiconiux aconitum]